MSISSDYLSLQPSYYIDLNLNGGHEDVDQLFDHRQVIHHHTTPFSFSNLQQPYLSSSGSSLSSSSSSSSPFYLNSVTDQAGYGYMGSQVQPYRYQQEVENLSLYESGSYDQTTIEINKSANKGLKFSICKNEDKSFGVEDGGGSGSAEINGSPVKWMSSKMRLMKKMMRTGEDHKAEADNRVGKITIKSSNNGNNSNGNNNNNENATIRVCSDCNTTKTPLWRSGPRGPKSLCNACGIRQRKARRAMAASAIAGNNTVLPYTPPSSVIKAGNNHKKASMINNNNGFGAQKKRSKMTKPSRDKRKLCFEEFALSLSKKLSIQQVFPQEEKDAAILLMALSCGLVHG